MRISADDLERVKQLEMATRPGQEFLAQSKIDRGLFSRTFKQIHNRMKKRPNDRFGNTPIGKKQKPKFGDPKKGFQKPAGTRKIMFR